LILDIVKPKLTDYQEKFLYNPSRFTVTEASTKSGKTFAHIYWIYERAHEDWNKPGHNHWWVAPVYSQAQIAFKRLKTRLASTGVYKINESNLIITCPNGSQIHFKSADKPDNLFGEDVYSVVFDEAPRAKVDAFYALRTTITATGGKMKLIGNFGGVSNWMHILKEKAKTDKEYAYFKITCWDAVKAGILEEAEILQAKKDLPKRVFKELYEAEGGAAEGQLINNESIRKLFTNTHIEGGVKYITADIARLGKDLTIIKVWDGLRNIETIRKEITKVDDSVELIKEMQVKYNVNNNNTIVDEDGVGGGVKDYLGCLGFVNGSTPVKVSGEKLNFSNLKTQCYWKLAELINRNEIYVDVTDEEIPYLTGELEMVRLPKELDTSKISILGKDGVKKELGRSPDYSDALMMRMYFELDPHRGKYYIY